VKIIGRQPATTYTTPSNPSPWYGAIRPDDRFTVQQRLEMTNRELDPDAIEVLKVRRQASAREMWWPTGAPPPVFEFDCPVLSRRRDGRIDVIAPGGWKQIVSAEGWVGEPHRHNRQASAEIDAAES
jgi:hypothetical protein